MKFETRKWIVHSNLVWTEIDGIMDFWCGLLRDSEAEDSFYLWGEDDRISDTM